MPRSPPCTPRRRRTRSGSRGASDDAGTSHPMDFKDYYSALGVDRHASDEDIRKAYRKLARKYHPDVSKEPDADQKMRDINEARDVLSDKEKRTAYDTLADHVARGGSPEGDFHPPPGWDQGFEFHRGPHSG